MFGGSLPLRGVIVNVSLTPHLERMVKDRVASGRYSSASEIVREALRTLETRDRAREAHLQGLRADVATGLSALDGGGVTPGDDAFDEAIDDLVDRAARAS